MRGKKIAVGLLAGLMICLNAGCIEAKVYDTSASATRTVDAAAGANVSFLALQTQVAASFDMADKCAAEHVKPYFAAKGITLSDDVARAVGFGALELSNTDKGSSGSNVYFKAEGHVYYDESLDYVYENKKFINAFVAAYNELAAINRDMGPALAGYAQYKDSDSAEILRSCNAQRQALYQRFANMQEYFLPGAMLLVTGSDVNFRSEPNTSCEVVDVLQMDEQLQPVRSVNNDGRNWYYAINAKGDYGYVVTDYVRMND
jgi:hypothetical protein